MDDAIMLTIDKAWMQTGDKYEFDYHNKAM